MKIIVTGSSGFIGREIANFFSERGDQVIRLVRTHTNERNSFFWDPYKKIIDPSIFKECDVIINLVGESIIGRWNEEKKKAIYDSRVISTRFLVETVKQSPPKVFIQASAIGYYGDRGDETLTEDSSAGNDFLAKVCQDWEKATMPIQHLSRVLQTRFGLVLSPKGGALKRMLPAFKMGLAGQLGSGQQYVSWIALEDLVKAMDYLIKNENLKGPVNFVAPTPVINEKFTKVLAELLRRPAFLSMPDWLLKTIFGEGAQSFLASIKVEPRKLLESGYVFLYSDIESALKACL